MSKGEYTKSCCPCMLITILHYRNVNYILYISVKLLKSIYICEMRASVFLKILPYNIGMEEWFSRRCAWFAQSAAIVLVLRKWILDIYFFDFIPMPNAGGNAGLIRKLHSFPADVLLSDYCSRYNTDLSPPLLSIILYAFIFSLIALSFRSTASFLPTPHFPVKFRRCSFKSTS